MLKLYETIDKLEADGKLNKEEFVYLLNNMSDSLPGMPLKSQKEIPCIFRKPDIHKGLD